MTGFLVVLIGCLAIGAEGGRINLAEVAEKKYQDQMKGSATQKISDAEGSEDAVAGWRDCCVPARNWCKDTNYEKKHKCKAHREAARQPAPVQVHHVHHPAPAQVIHRRDPPADRRGGARQQEVKRALQRMPTHTVKVFAQGLWLAANGDMNRLFDVLNGNDRFITKGEWRRAIGRDSSATEMVFRTIASQEGGRGASWDDDRTIDQKDWRRFFSVCEASAQQWARRWSDDVFAIVVSARVTAERLFDVVEGGDWDKTLSQREWNAAFSRFDTTGRRPKINRAEFAGRLGLHPTDTEEIFQLLEDIGDYSAGGDGWQSRKQARNDENTIDLREWQNLFPWMVGGNYNGWRGGVQANDFINDLTGRVICRMYSHGRC